MATKNKFRVWDSKNLKWIKRVSIDCETGVTITHLRDSGIELDSKLEITQCTGLKDKNGKEIFEGDILYGELDLRESDEFGRQYTGDLFTFKGPVIYKSPSFIVENADFPLDNYNSLEVVGNIFENE